MRTIRLNDPFARGQAPKQLEWGSSAWAADSCLVEWSRFEREWLEPQPTTRTHAPGWAWNPRDIPATAWLVVGALSSALVLAICS